MRTILSGLFIVAALAACSPTLKHDKPCHGKASHAAAKEHKSGDCKKGFCPHKQKSLKETDHDADYHNRHSH